MRILRRGPDAVRRDPGGLGEQEVIQLSVYQWIFFQCRYSEVDCEAIDFCDQSTLCASRCTAGCACALVFRV